MGKRSRQSGAVSLFSVIFATMLLTVLVSGFVRLMIRDQQQATNNDLSQSAYDAALAGVEDAKRVIRASQAGDSKALAALSNPERCTVIQRAEIAGVLGDGEVKIKSASAGESFDQAYTCVNITMDTPDYLFESHEDKTWLVPMQSGGEFNQVAIEWYTREDANNKTIGSLTGFASTALPPRASWVSGTIIPGLPSSNSVPSMLRAQVITPGEQIVMENLNTTGKTTFIKPISVTSGTPTEIPVDLRGSVRSRVVGDGASGSNDLHSVTCTARFIFNNEYACRTVLEIDDISESASRNAFLRISSIYSGAHVRITLLKDGVAVNFRGVQPSVDSTGRANNLFRRVEARLQLGDDFPYPEGVVDVASDVCKDFSVTDVGVVASGTECNPVANPSTP